MDAEGWKALVKTSAQLMPNTGEQRRPCLESVLSVRVYLGMFRSAGVAVRRCVARRAQVAWNEQLRIQTPPEWRLCYASQRFAYERGGAAEKRRSLPFATATQRAARGGGEVPQLVRFTSAAACATEEMVSPLPASGIR